MTLPKEGFSVTIIIDFQDNTLKLSKFNFVLEIKKMLCYVMLCYVFFFLTIQ